MSPELINLIFQISRYLFAFLGFFAVLSALGWVHSEKKQRLDRLRSIPEAGKVGELVVLSGGDELPDQTWFPVTREGVLGSVRSCDLVVPCPGVKARHLDYVWEDGIGLMIRPRSGCEALVDGVLLNCRSDMRAYPLTHGSCLQVGNAVLRLQVLKALDHTYSPVVQPPVEEACIPDPASFPVPEFQPAYYPPVETVPAAYPAVNGMSPKNPPVPVYEIQPGVSEPFSPATGLDLSGSPLQPDSRPVPAPSRRRSDRWKEDWSE